MIERVISSVNKAAFIRITRTLINLVACFDFDTIFNAILSF